MNNLKKTGGNYAFVKRLANGKCKPLYFGESGDLSQRLPGHEMWERAVSIGATHIMAHTTPSGESARKVEEVDLIDYWDTELNTQHR